MPGSANRRLPVFLIGAGLVLTGGGLGADLLGGSPGLGAAQVALIVVGSAMLLGGVLLLTSWGRARLGTLQAPEGEPDTRGVLTLALWFGLCAGLADPALIQLQNALGHRFSYLNPHMSWMSPLSYTVLFAVALVPLVVLGRGRRGWLRSRRVAATLLSFMTAASLLLLYHPEVHEYATLVLSLGVATQVWRVLERRAASFARVVSRTLVPLAGLVLVAIGSHLGLPWAAEQLAKRNMPTPAPDAPNVILIVLDTVRGANVSFNGYERETTPNLDRRAADGIVFERAISTGPYSMTTHVSLVTGLYPHSFEADWVSPLEDSLPTLPEVLEERGYLSGGFFANRSFGGRHSGLSRGFHHWDVDVTWPVEILGASHVGRMFIQPRIRLIDKLHNFNPWAQKHGRVVTSEFLSWVRKADGRPFFAYLNYFDAHFPYDEPPGYEGAFAGVPRPPLPLSGPYEQQQVDRAINGYDASILFLDDQLEQIFVELESLGLYENTMVIVVSDHGEEFAEKGEVGHSRTLNYPVMHVPLMVLFPDGRAGGTRVGDFVSVREVPATILEVTGGEDARIPGRTLARYARARPEGHPAADSAGTSAALETLVLGEVTDREWVGADGSEPEGNLIAVFSRGLHYTRSAAGTETLFDVLSDRWEQNDLAADPSYAADLERFRAATDSIAVHYMQRDARGAGR